MNTTLSPEALRARIRQGQHTGHTSGFCHGFVQCNLAILPADWASDFLLFCQRNPKPCPIIHVASQPGETRFPALGAEFDVRSDFPQYRVWQHGELVEEIADISRVWRDDLVSFFIGCSFSFEEALLADGLEVRNITEGCNVPMYTTNIDCQSAGRFASKLVVSMRPFVPADAIRMIQICSRFPAVHGAPVHFGDPSAIGITDLNTPDFGDAVTLHADEVPVFTACGVTPQAAIMQAKPPFCITHSPGCMGVTDIPNSRMAVM